MKAISCLVLIALMGYTHSTSDKCIPRSECPESSLWTGPICVKTEHGTDNFVDQCDIAYAECKAGKTFERLPFMECNFPQDYGHNPKWIGK